MPCGALDFLSEVPVTQHTNDHRLVGGSVVGALTRQPEWNRFMKEILAWVGSRKVAVDVDRASRQFSVGEWNDTGPGRGLPTTLDHALRARKPGCLI